jgi:hypothetical protein
MERSDDQFAGQIASSTNVTTIATARVAQRINCGCSAALIITIAPPEHIEM